MPIYEYACTNCGERTEAKQSFTDPPLEECPHCGGLLRKLYSPVGIVFKGTGFYATDARKGSSKTSEKTSSPSSKDGDSSSGSGASKSESKSSDSGSSTGSTSTKSD